MPGRASERSAVVKRPAFQFYPADWRNNAKLRRCSEAARGAWMDILCALHDSDEYGVVRWPLADLARAAGVPLKLAKELVEKDVLKGGDAGCAAYVYTPVSGRIHGAPVVLVEAGAGAPCWYSTRLVRDEYVRQRRGNATQFGNGAEQCGSASPKGGMGARLSDGPTTPAASASSASPAADTPSAQFELARELQRLGVNVTPHHPLLAQWLQDGYTPPQIRAALATARLSKPPPATMPAKYLDTVLRNPNPPRSRTDEQAETIAALTGRTCHDGAAHARAADAARAPVVIEAG